MNSETEKKTEYIIDEFKKINKNLSDKQAWQFYRFYELLVKKNKVMNLTAITEFEDVVQKHFLDSCLFSEKYIDLNSNKNTMIDIGTGAGFPGIPLKILYPELKITLLDSLNKRILFLEEVIHSLELDNIVTVHDRAEDGARKIQLREQFDYVVSRAVANLSILSEYCIPYAKVGGLFIAFKSGKIEEEANDAKKAISLLGAKQENTLTTLLPHSDISRSIILIRKQNSTSKKYPRKAGIPSRQPLGNTIS